MICPVLKNLVLETIIRTQNALSLCPCTWPVLEAGLGAGKDYRTVHAIVHYNIVATVQNPPGLWKKFQFREVKCQCYFSNTDTFPAVSNQATVTRDIKSLNSSNST